MKNNINFKSISLLILVVLISVFSVQAQDGFTINGKITGLDDGAVIKLVCSQLEIDTTTATVNGKFRFTGKATDKPLHASIYVKNKDEKYSRSKSTHLYLENGRYNLETDIADLKYALVTGNTEANTSVNDLKKLTAIHNRKIDSLSELSMNQPKIEVMEINGRKLDQPLSIQDTSTVATAQRDVWKKEKNVHYLEIDKIKRAFIDDYPDSFQTLLILDGYARTNMDKRGRRIENKIRLSNEEMKIYFNKLSPKLQVSDIGKALSASLFEKTGVELGEAFIEFKDTYVISKNNTPFKLSDIKTDFVLVEFTSTWCSGCIKFKKAMIPEYDKIKDKMEVVSVYTDSKKEPMLKEYAKNEIDWLMVTDYKGINSPMMKRYQVSPIPHFFLFNKERKLVYKQTGFGPPEGLQVYYDFVPEIQAENGVSEK